MPLNLPNLDDRSYKDLVQEALASIPAHAPEWTNHNPSDPGITLVELFAYLTEMLIYRVNRVTDENYHVFLKLLRGPDWKPSPSKSLTEQIREAVLELRETNRAVTCDDFERLARQADPRVARAHCMPRRNLEAEAASASVEERPGHISMILVPAAGAAAQPDADLLKKVKDYLEPRRLLTTRVHVVGPRYFHFDIRLTLVLKLDSQKDKVKKMAEDTLKEFYDPRIGGDQGQGWPFGRDAYVSEVYQLLDTIPGVDYVTRTIDSQTHQPVDELVAPADRLLWNAEHNLVAVRLLPDELIDPQGISFELTMQSP